MARKPPKSPEQRLARWSRSMSPGTLNGRVAAAAPLAVDVTRLAPRLRQQPISEGGFDPNEDPVVIGLHAAGSLHSVALGNTADATGDSGVAVGSGTSALGTFSVAVGNNAGGLADYSVVVGENATVPTGSNSGIAIGASAGGHGVSAIAIGGGALVQAAGGTAADYGIAIGQSAAVSAPHATAIGQESSALGYYSVGIGTFVYAAGQDSIAIGRSAEVDEDDGIAIGHSSWVKTGHTQSIALGYHATTTKPAQIMLGAATNVAGTPYFVEIPGLGVVLKDSATGTRYLLRVTSGAVNLTTAP